MQYSTGRFRFQGYQMSGKRKRLEFLRSNSYAHAVRENPDALMRLIFRFLDICMREFGGFS